MDKDERGRAGERRAADHLVSAGYEIVARNWRCPQGEIDVVAAHGGEIVFVEVKTRRSIAYGHPFEAIDARKRDRLWRLAFAWAVAHPGAVQNRRLRVDVIAVTGESPADARVEHLVDLR